MNKDTLAKALEIAWRRYTERFNAPPRGTYKQLRALVELCPNIGLIEDEDVTGNPTRRERGGEK